MLMEMEMEMEMAMAMLKMEHSQFKLQLVAITWDLPWHRYTTPHLPTKRRPKEQEEPPQSQIPFPQVSLPSTQPEHTRPQSAPREMYTHGVAAKAINWAIQCPRPPPHRCPRSKQDPPCRARKQKQDFELEMPNLLIPD